MGDGGVAYMPSQHVMERFPISETFCGGNGGFSSKSLQFGDSQRKQKKVEVEKGQFSSQRGRKEDLEKGDLNLEKGRKGEVEKGEFVLEKQRNGEVEKGDIVSENWRKGEAEKGEILQEKWRKGEVEKGEFVSEKWRRGEVEKGEIVHEKWQKGEVEKGEFVSVKWRKGELEKGEIVQEKWRKGEVVKGEFVSEKWRKGEVEKGEFVPEKWRKGEVEKGGFVSEKWRKGELEKGEFIPDKWRREEVEKSEFGSGRGRKDEVEKGEFIPDKWRKGEVEKGELISEKWRRGDRSTKKESSSMEEFSSGRFRAKNSPPSVKFTEDFPQKKDFSRSGTDCSKRSSWRDTASERNSKSSSRVYDEELGSYSDGKNNSKDYTLGTSPKRHAIETESSTRKHRGEFSDRSGLKSRRISEDNNRSSYSGKLDKFHSQSSTERSYRNNSASKVSSSSRYSSRNYVSSSSSRGAYDRHGRSPGHLERSPHDRARHYNHRDRSPAHPGHLEWSPHDRTRYHDHRDRSPSYSEWSPHDRARYHDHRDRSPTYSERSPHDRVRHRDQRDRTPLYSERSPHDRGRTHDHRDTNKKSGGSERQYSRYGNQGQEERLGSRETSNGRDSRRLSSTIRQSHNDSSFSNSTSCPDDNVEGQFHKEKDSQNPTAVCSEPPSQVNEAPQDLPSMEEDMDICDTPPHVPIVTEMNVGKWFYLDYFGIEQGPSRLCDLKKLVEDGVLQSDHLIKHSECNRWVTVENADSLGVPDHLQSIVSDTVTQLVNPPEAPGNLLVDIGRPGNQQSPKSSASLLQSMQHMDGSLVTSECLEDLHIDERVGALLNGYTVIPGRELETLGEVLHMTFEHAEWEKWGSSEGFTRFRGGSGDPSGHPRYEEFGGSFESMSKETRETRLVAPSEKECLFPNSNSSDWIASLWSCKGGDWKKNDEAAVQDKFPKRKLVLNEGYPLCQMPKSGYEDPRRHRKEDLYHPSRSRRLELPCWAFSWAEERNDSNGDMNKSMVISRSSQLKPLLARGVKGTMLPVVRINACVVKDHGSSLGDSRMKVKGNERHTSRFVRSFSASSDGRSPSTEGVSRPTEVHEHELQALLKCRADVNIPKDRVCTVDELQLNLGDWYYLDGAGHEHGPALFSELEALAAKGIIQKHSSVFRKNDMIWVPITTGSLTCGAAHTQEENGTSTSDSSQVADSLIDMTSSSFHNSHPQFIGYTCGKLHELVMKSYKSREFAAAINEVLDPWISAKQPKKELDKHFPFNSSITKSSTVLSHDSSAHKFRKSEDDVSGVYKDHIRAGKRGRLLFDESEEEYEMDEDLHTIQKNDFDELCGEATIGEENSMRPQTETESWGLLNGHILARVFHFLKTDLKSLAFSAATCKCWNTALKFYRDISRQVDFSSAGPNCNDSMFWNIMSGYDKTKITSVILLGCTNVSTGALEEVLQSFPCISSVDIRGCSQFRELTYAFKNVKWIRNHGLRNTKILEGSNSKIRSLKHITEKSSLNSKASKGSSELGDYSDQYPNLDRKDPGSHTFWQSCYKRTKLLDARKSSSVLSRDAQMRRLWLRRKSENEYKRMEEFLAVNLKDIMKENTFEFFIPKVAKIEDRMKNGYYKCHGLKSVTEDITRMCRDALKAKNRSMKHIIMLFFQLVTSLEENAKSFHERDEMIKSLKDSPVSGVCSVASKYKKKHNKVLNERRSAIRSNGTSFVNGGIDYGDYASDREIRKRLSKLNKMALNSESETSDDHDISEEDVRGDHETTDSETESDPDIRSDGGTGNLRDGPPFMVDEALDSMSEDREWGARMTKASLVPPVTRKYEVIDQYVVIADEDEVQRKMRVALPDDYAEKLSAQKNSTEELDMEIPEVKDYKPRKTLGDEVLEQEVYGIDPYTHNLLLDSMPEDSEWSLIEKHLFIEEVLLRTLNKQVRHFTGTGNTPMVYPLQPVVEEMLKTSEEGDTRIMKMCQSILKAMQNRSDDNYVSYRKGLGVVCNKQDGFSEEDFVVEFLGEVYPAWKWFEKQDGIRSLQKNNKDPAPEFYNIYLERPKGDRDGYDLVVVDAMHKANYASRICHSCRPNCEAKVTAVDGQYQIGIYTVRPIGYGEEITFDYNSVTESKEEYEASVCLCGSQVCRGSYLNLTGEGAFQKVLKECHGILDRHQLMLEACEVNSVCQEDYIDLGRAGLGTCLLAGLPDWLIAYSARLVRFINSERTMLPEEILNHNLEEKRKFFSDICLEVEKSDAEIQAEGVYNQRLQNLALTLDKVRYVMGCVFGDPKKAPPPLEKLSSEASVSILWKGEGSLVEELLQSLAPHVDADLLNDLKSKIHAHDPSDSDDLQRELRKSLLWLRDEIRNLQCSNKCRNDAAADLIHMYAYTKCFFKVRDYQTVTSPPVYISPLDLGPKHADKLGSGFQEYCKTYGENYCLGQLIYWHNQANAEPDCSLARARRGCLSLPDVASFYTKSQKPTRKRAYGPRTVKFMLSRIEKQPQRSWPKDRIWTFKSSAQIFGSPMLDAVMNKSALDKEMVHWLKSRPPIFQGMWDR
ncbi:histone-lysine N-methyltransferase ATXR3-like isoform X2 [Tasmannia lanceolata]|uniref:histone-lysine N-methyltransferase ATXR3-like isoform X2 n=1 Tax=Tasmannia lanceolata TaxID=3420 RepID=UPI004063D59A